MPLPMFFLFCCCFPSFAVCFTSFVTLLLRRSTSTLYPSIHPIVMTSIVHRIVSSFTFTTMEQLLSVCMHACVCIRELRIRKATYFSIHAHSWLYQKGPPFVHMRIPHIYFIPLYLPYYLIRSTQKIHRNRSCLSLFLPVVL